MIDLLGIHRKVSDFDGESAPEPLKVSEFDSQRRFWGSKVSDFDGAGPPDAFKGERL